MRERRPRLHLFAAIVAAGCCVALAGWSSMASTAATPSRTFLAGADAYVQRNQPKANFGTAVRLKFAALPTQRTYLRFDVKGLAGKVTRATLRVHTLRGSPTGYQVWSIQPKAWREHSITYANAPSRSRLIASSGPLKGRAWSAVDVTPLVQANRPLSLVLSSTAAHGLLFDSREGGASSAPRLVVESRTAPLVDPVIAAAGDIACDPGTVVAPTDVSTECHQQATSDLLVGEHLDAVLALGDDQYLCGGYQAFLESYEPTWGRLKAITHPVPGNHEYQVSGGTDCDATGTAAGYFRYFGAAAGRAGEGYYSFDLGAWHLVALNSNCDAVGGCTSGSPQETWLRADLAAHQATCTLAYWHHPRFTSGDVGDGPEVAVFWRDLSAAGADVVLNGHAHGYERFAPQDANGSSNPSTGLREFVVGTGGEDFQPFTASHPLSEVRDNATFGVLKLTLHDKSYDWRFLPEVGATFGDFGSAACH
jgi:acid phosphatase type 7